MSWIVLWPLYSVAGWICDGAMYGVPDPKWDTCVSDLNGDGHRSNIMTAGSEVGCGYAQSGIRITCTCDSGSGDVYPTRVIKSAAHIFTSTASSYIYMANVYSTGTVSSVVVYVNGVPTSMTLQSGTASSGTYQSSSFTYTSTDPCKSYYFVVTVGGVTEQFPDSGTFQTYGAGACVADYLASTTSSSATSTSSSATSTSSGVTSTSSSATSTSSGVTSTSSGATSSSSSSSSVTGTRTSTTARETSSATFGKVIEPIMMCIAAVIVAAI